MWPTYGWSMRGAYERSRRQPATLTPHSASSQKAQAYMAVSGPREALMALLMFGVNLRRGGGGAEWGKEGFQGMPGQRGGGGCTPDPSRRPPVPSPHRQAARLPPRAGKPAQRRRQLTRPARRPRGSSQRRSL